MTAYRRNRIPGGTYFFTVNLQDRRTTLLVDRIELLRACVRRVHALHPFHIDAWVVLPDHMHALWTLPEGDTAYARRWQAIKMAFSKGVEPGEPRTINRASRDERGIWQRRYWEHTIRDERDYAAHIDYIHFNPVKHGLASSAADWPYSSFRRCVAKGMYPSEWSESEERDAFWGERAKT
jgi:putative transposase